MVKQLRALDDVHSGEDDEEVPADGTTYIWVNGTCYELDLTEEHAKALAEDLEPWLRHASKVKGLSAPRPIMHPGGKVLVIPLGELSDAPSTSDRNYSWLSGPDSKELRAQIRTWGKEVGELDEDADDRGRVSYALADAWLAAHPDFRPSH